MAEREKRRATTFVTSRGAIINVAAPSVYIAPGVTPVDVTSPAEMREELTKYIQPINFVQNRSYGSGGYPYFCHWVEPITPGINRLVIPFSYSALTDPFGIFVSDDGLNIREVYRSVTPNENYGLVARTKDGNIVLVGSGSSGAFGVASLYRSRNNPELNVWTNILANIDRRIYGLEWATDYFTVLVGTCNAGASVATSGLILRSTNITVAVPTFTTVATLAEGVRTIKRIDRTRTMLAGTGNPNGAGIHRSIDEGVTWILAYRFSSAEKAVYWFHEDITTGYIYACLESGSVYKSVDDGLTWSSAFSVYGSMANPLIRRTVYMGGRVYAAVSHLGPSLVDFENGKVYPIYTEGGNINNYCLCKFRGGLVTLLDEDIAYSGKVQTAHVPLWSSQAVADLVNGSTTSHFSSNEHNKASAYIYSTQAGTLYIQALDEVSLAFRDIANVPVVANTLTIYNLVDTKGGYFRLRFVPTVAATVSSWVVLG